MYDSEWNEETISCKGKGFDVMLTTIVGTGVICKYLFLFSCWRFSKCCICSDQEETIHVVPNESSCSRANVLSHVII